MSSIEDIMVFTILIVLPCLLMLMVIACAIKEHNSYKRRVEKLQEEVGRCLERLKDLLNQSQLHSEQSSSRENKHKGDLQKRKENKK